MKTTWSRSLESIARKSMKPTMLNWRVIYAIETQNMTQSNGLASYRNTEAEAIAQLRFESSVSSNAREKMEHYEMLYNNERALTNELKTEIEDRNVKLRRSLQEGPMAIGHGSNQHAIQHLETEVKGRTG